MPLNTENPYNSAFGLEPEQNKLLNAINASKLRDENTTPDEFAMSNYRGPSFEPKGRILPTFKETGQGITAIGGSVAGMALGGIAEIGNYINRKLGIDDVPVGSSLDYWQNKLAYMPTEPTAQRAVQAFNLPFEGLRFVADKVGHGVQDTALRLGINEKDAADLGAIIALGAEFKVLVFTNKGFKNAKGFVGIKTKSVLGKINEIFNKGADEVTIKQAVSDLKNAFKEEVPIENLSEVQKMALDQLTKENEVPIIDYMEHIQELSSEGIVKGLTEKKKVTKRAKKTKVKADEMKTGDVSAATEIIKETEKNKLVPTTDNIELTPSVYSPSDNYFSKPELRSNRTYVWRSMGSSEYNKLMTGQKRYSEGTGKGNFFASVPESASQFKGPGKYLVEFKATATDEGLIKGSNVGPEHVTRIWKYSPSKKVWNEIKIEEYTTKERNAVTIKNIITNDKDYLYHNTTDEALKGITTKGLLTNNEGKTPIALATDEITAKGFKKGNVLLRVKSDIVGIEDAAYDKTKRTFTDIPPDQIEIKTDKGWRSLKGKPTIPELNSTEDSIAFAKVATKEQLAEVERLREVHGKKANDLLDESRNIEDKTKRMDVMNQAMEESVKSQLYRKVIEAKNEPERFGQIVKELPTTEEIPKPKITKADKANVVAKKHGIEFISEEAIEELVGEKGNKINVPHYQFFDPITGEYFLTRSPSSKVVAEELATLRELRNVNDSVNKKLTFGDFNREANDIISGKSKTKPEDFLTTLREFTENISEDEIGPGKRFETTVDVIEHTDMGREFSSRFRREMIKRGKMEEPGIELYSGLPIHLAKDIVKDLNNIFKTVYRGISERVSVKGLKPEDAKVYEKMKNDHEATLTSSEQRGVFEIGKDLETLEDFRANEKFTIDKLKALQLLESDAKRLKQPFDDYLAELGFTPEQVSRAMSESKKIRNKIEPLDETQPINVEVQNTNNPIVKQRQWKGKDKSIITAPPIYADDIRMMENAVDLSPQVGFKTLGTMIRIFEDAGLKPIYNMWREADAVVVREGVAVDNFLKDLTNRYKINRKNRQNIITYAYQQQEGGMRILEANKIKPVKLTPDEMSAYSEMRAMYEDYFERINAVRRSIGREPIKKVDDYFTFARVINNLQREGIINNLIREDATMIMNQYTHFKSTPFRFARNRTGGLFNPELDAFKVFKMYSNTASKHINISPVAAKVNELTNTRLPLSDGSGSVQYSVIKPNTAKFLNDWSDFISGKPVVSKWPGWVGDKGLRLLRKNIGWATLQWNVRSILIQPAAIQNSITELGLKYVSEGFIDNLNPSMRKMAMEKSNHLLSRIPETEINDWAYLGKIWKAGFKPMQWTDLETARTTWLGAYKFGKEVHGLSGKELINFADDTVVRTQGSAGAGDIAAIQRSEMGKALTMFQTFTINNWDFMTKDVLGLKGLKVTRPVDFQKVMRLVLSITAINILYEDLLGIPSPNPRPIKNVIDGVSKGKNFGQVALSTTKELLEPVPIIGGSFKYEKQIGGPVFELLSETGKKFTNESIQKDWMEILSMASGIPGTRQVIKYYKGQKRGEGFMGSLLGTYSEKQGTGGRPSRSGRSSRGSR